MAMHRNWMAEIATSATLEELTDVMTAYCYAVGYGFNSALSYRHHIHQAESLRLHGVAQRFKEAEHRARFLK